MLLLTRVVWFSALCAVALGCPPIVSRHKWGARPPTNSSPLSTPVPYVVIHHTAGNPCTSQDSCSQQVRNIQNQHMDSNGWADIGYNFLIGEDGRVYEGRGWRTVGAHASSWNAKSLGFSFLGDFSGRVPNTAALRAAKSLIQCTIAWGYLSRRYRLKGARDVIATISPGNALYKEITGWARFKA